MTSITSFFDKTLDWVDSSSKKVSAYYVSHPKIKFMTDSAISMLTTIVPPAIGIINPAQMILIESIKMSRQLGLGTKVKNLLNNNFLTRPITKALETGLGMLTTYNLIDMGLANLLCLEQLRHGTSLKGYLGIQLNGADPNFGGASAGSSAGVGFLGEKRISTIYQKNSKGFFHVFRDSTFSDSTFRTATYCKVALKDSAPQFLVKPFCDSLPLFTKRLLPAFHKILAGVATMNKDKKEINTFQLIVGAIAGFFTPTLIFRFRPEDIAAHGLDDDGFYGGDAYRTQQKIGTEHLGITGSLRQGLDATLFQRIVSNPYQALLGLGLLACAVYSANKTYESFHKKNPEISPTQPTSDSSRFKEICKKWIIKPIAILSLICYNTL